MNRYNVRDITTEINERGKTELMKNLVNADEIFKTGTYREMIRQSSFFGALAAPPLLITYTYNGETKAIKVKLLFRQNFVNVHTLTNKFVATSTPNRVFCYNVTFRMDLALDGKSFLDFHVRPAKYHIGRAIFAHHQIWIFQENDICNQNPIWPTPTPWMLPFLPKPDPL